ncbi:MAG: hypothetical protein HKN47_03840, partial [Pirellulaceae bacterium]|nr:hypothetical protein [Pirellulaceae bacterium]
MRRFERTLQNLARVVGYANAGDATWIGGKNRSRSRVGVFVTAITVVSAPVIGGGCAMQRRAGKPIAAQRHQSTQAVSDDIHIAMPSDRFATDVLMPNALPPRSQMP